MNSPLKVALLLLLLAFSLALASSLSFAEGQESGVSDKSLLQSGYEVALGKYIAEYSRILGTKKNCPFSLTLFTELNSYREKTGAEGSNIAFSLRGQVYLLADGSKRRALRVRRALRHEAVHLLLYCLAERSLPAWLEEGLAVHFEGKSRAYLKYFHEHADNLRLIDLNHSFSSLEKEQQQLAYAKSSFAAKNLLNSFGYQKINSLLMMLSEGTDFREAFKQVFGISVESFDQSLLRQAERAALRK